MRNATAARIEVPQADEAGRERRAPAPAAIPEAAARRCGSALHWPMSWPISWPAVLYVGDAARDCTVRAFSAESAQLSLAEPPPAGAAVVLKFPFAVHLKGEVAWSGERDLGLSFDAAAQPSARILEDLLLKRGAAG